MKLLILPVLIGISVLIGAKMAPYAPKLYETKAIIIRPTLAPQPVKTSDIVALIAETFDKEGKQVIYEALSVAKNESGWRHNAVNWNCKYSDKSTSCAPGDRGKAWSVDCGLMQINVKGQTCPEELFNVKTNIQRAYEMYKRRDWQPWVAAKNLGYVK